MDIGQGAGLSGASGIRPFLPTLLAGALAREDTGLDFDGTSFDFLESPWFLLAVLVLGVVAYSAERRQQQAPAPKPGEPRANIAAAADRRDPLAIAMLVIGVVLGALLFAGSLADHGYESWPGAIGGAVCALIGYLALASLFARARRRLQGSRSDSGGALTLLGVYADLIALAIAGLSILFPPLAFVALAAFLVLLVRSRGEGAQKFEGLRILR
jgi:hypothetical protein